MKKESVLVFPDPEASFFCYMRQQDALRKHTARQNSRPRPESLRVRLDKARLDFPNPQSGGASSLNENEGPTTRTGAPMGRADEAK